MTVAELYRAVAQLGAEDSLESNSGFYPELNRALLQVCALRPAISSYVINHRMLNNLLSGDAFTPREKKGNLEFFAEGVKAYTFECDGNGTCFIEYEENGEWNIAVAITLDGNGTYKRYKGLLKINGKFTESPIRMRFTGDYVYFVKNVAMYEDIYSNDPNDIEDYLPYKTYDMKDIVQDFLFFDNNPIWIGERQIKLYQGYLIEGTKILLPIDKVGQYKVLYCHKPRSIEESDDETLDDTVIDLDDELVSILPLLVAAYVWADGEPEKANYYLALYNERAETIKENVRDISPGIIRNVTGW